MTQSTNFYVYEHWRPDTGACFYVGKGRGNRAWKLSARSKWHRAIIAKLVTLGFAVDIRIVAKDLSEADAFKLERHRIALYPKGSLCNLTMGGEGFAGMRLTAEHKKKIAENTRRAFAERPELGAKISAIHKGKAKSAETRKRMALAAARRGADPAYRQKMSEAKRDISDETRAKMTEGNHRRWAKIRQNPGNYPKIFAGHAHSEETKAKLSAARVGKRLSVEQKAKHSAILKASWIKRRATKEQQDGLCV